MSDVYVDKSAAGTGDGSSPTNAYVAVQSVAWGDGVRAWVRNTHTEGITSSVFVGANSYISGFSKRQFLIGWPSSGMPYYDDRPAAGVSAGWDSDVPTTIAQSTFGYNLPALTNSNNTTLNGGFLLGRETNIANFYLVNCGGAQAIIWNNADGIPELCQLDNVVPLLKHTVSPNFVMMNKAICKHIILCMSSALSTPVFNDTQLAADMIEIHSLSVLGFVIQQRQNGYIGHLVNWSSSISYFADDTNANIESAGYPVGVTVGRASGTAPFSGYANKGAHQRQSHVACDDYFGLGAYCIAVPENDGWRVASTTEAQHNSTAAVVTQVSSVIATSQWYRGRKHNAALRAFFDVTSGTLITVRVPMYCDSTGVFSPSGGSAYGHLQCRGATPRPVVRSMALVGSPTSWAGSLIAGGSAYLLEFKFTPKETATQVPFEVFFPQLTQATSGTGINAYALLGSPFSV